MKKAFLTTAAAISFCIAAGGIGYTVTNNYNQANIKDLNTQIEQKETTNADQRQEISGLNKYINSLTVEKDNLIAENNNKSESIKNLQSDIENKQTQIENLQNDMTAKSNKIETLNSQISSNNTQISNLQADIDEKKAEIARLEAEGEDNTATINSLNADIQNKQTQISNLTADVATKTSELNDLQTRFDELEEKYGSCYDELDQSKARVTELENEIATNNTTINDLNTQLTQKQSELAALQLSINEKDETINDFKNTLNTIRKNKSLSKVSKTYTLLGSINNLRDFWTDGNNVYCTKSAGENYVVDLENMIVKKANFTVRNPSVWFDGENYYSSTYTEHYLFNKQNQSWESVSFEGVTQFRGDMVWDDGTDRYLNYQNQDYKFNKDTKTWEAVTFTGLTNVNAAWIWHDEANTYYSDGSNHYKFNPSTKTFNVKEWNYSVNGGGIWNCDSQVYYTYKGNNYKLNKETDNWEKIETSSSLDCYTGDIYVFNNKAYYTDEYKKLFSINTENLNLKEISLSGSISVDLRDVWSDGDNYYYSFLSDTNYHYKINFETSRLESVWSSSFSARGRDIWSAGSDVYATTGGSLYLLNKETKTWDETSFKVDNSSITGLIGADVIHVNNDVFYLGKTYNGSTASSTCLLKYNFETKNWETIDGFSSISISGENVFSNGINFYGINPRTKTQYIIDFNNYTYKELGSSEKLNGLNSFYGYLTATDGINLYAVNNGALYQYDYSSSTWKKIQTNVTGKIISIKYINSTFYVGTNSSLFALV